jgi:hypothetical protein
LKLSSDVDNSGSKKKKQTNKSYDDTYGGTWRSLESGGRLCGYAFGRKLASVAAKMFPYLILFLRNSVNFALSLQFLQKMLQ